MFRIEKIQQQITIKFHAPKAMLNFDWSFVFLMSELYLVVKANILSLPNG